MISIKLKINSLPVISKVVNKLLMTACVTSLLVGSGSASALAAAAASQQAISEVNLEYRIDNVKEGNSFKVFLNNENVTNRFDENPIQVTTEGRTLLPLRTLGEILSSQIDWDANNKVAIVKTNAGKTIEVPIGATNMIIDGTINKIDNEGTQAIILSSRTYLPFRAIAEACGAKVDYQVGSDGSKNIYLTTGSTAVIPEPTGDVLEPTWGNYTKENPANPAMAEAGFYTYAEMGYDATHGPDPSDPYYESWNAYVTKARKGGFTDEQINNNLQYIYGYDSTTSANEQFAVGGDIPSPGRPTQKGKYEHQMYYSWVWDGFNWCPDGETYLGIGHVGLTFNLIDVQIKGIF